MQTTELIIQVLVPIIVALIAGAGFWTWLTKRHEHKSAVTRLVLGLAHDRIIYLGMNYIDRGWVSKDEYDDFMTYLYGPYSQFGGNGLAQRVKEEVDKLPIRKYTKLEDLKTDAK